MYKDKIEEIAKSFLQSVDLKPAITAKRSDVFVEFVKEAK